MSFLDNLENNLKALESREEQDPKAMARARSAREAERAAALKRAPFEQELRDGPFSGALITACRRAGHARRIMVRPTWIGTVLRLEARWDDVDRRLEIEATGDGARAVFYEGDERIQEERVDLKGPADALAANWLGPA
ncbi:MAG: hypothetical protein R2729_23585 [Bryobacteraceae bacterium]